MPAKDEGSRFNMMIKQFKTYIIVEELEKNEGNICKTAKSFSMHRNSLTRHIHDLGISLEKYGRTKRKTQPATNSSSGIIPANRNITAGVPADVKGEE